MSVDFFVVSAGGVGAVCFCCCFFLHELITNFYCSPWSTIPYCENSTKTKRTVVENAGTVVRTQHIAHALCSSGLLPWQYQYGLRTNPTVSQHRACNTYYAAVVYCRGSTNTGYAPTRLYLSTERATIQENVFEFSLPSSLHKCDMDKFSTPDNSEKTIAILRDKTAVATKGETGRG